MLQFTRRIPIDKGWSGDRKYRVTTTEGKDCLLRIFPPEKSGKVRELFAMTQRIAAMGLPICAPAALEEHEDGAYLLQSWIDGRDAGDVIPQLPEDAQYSYGLDAGRILAKLHTLPAPDDREDWETRFNRKIDRKIAAYSSCPLKYPRGDAFIGFIAENRQLLRSRPQCFQHGDYHIGNMMVDNCGTLTVIDFERFDFGDPWEEFNRIVWCAQASPEFACGMVDGYFGGEVPEEFWRLTALYIASNTLSSLPWAVPFGQREIGVMLAQAEDVLGWYDGMRSYRPSWYKNHRKRGQHEQHA